MAKIRNYVRSLLLPKGFPILEYNPADGVKGILESGCTEARIVDIVNDNLHQKNGLVEGRDDLVTYLEEVAGFPMLMESKTVTNKSGTKTVEVPAETPAEMFKRFALTVAKGEFTWKGQTITGADVPAKQTAVWAALQAIVDAPVKITVKDGETSKEVTLFSLENDAKQSEPKTAKAAKIPQYAQAAAKNIVSDVTPDGTKKKTTLAVRLKTWAATFAERGLAVEDFQSNAPAGADDAAKAAHEATRLDRLARAIVANEAWESAQNAKKYA